MGSKLLAGTASLLIGLGTFLGIVLPGSSNAAAGPSTHMITTWGSYGPDVEGAVQGMYKCNPYTGSWKLSLSGIQVIESDGATEWPSLSVSTLTGPFSEESGNLAITQDTTDGLFEITFRSGPATNLAFPGIDCATGAQVNVVGGDGITFLVGTMS